MPKKLCIYWIRRDFRTNDNFALASALESARTQQADFLPLFIIDQNILTNEFVNVGFPRRKLLARILENYSQKFTNFRIYNGQASEIFKIISEKFSTEIYCNQDVEPYSLNRDKEISDIVTKNSGKFFSFPDQINVNLNLISNTGTKYTVFTPFREKALPDYLKLSKKTQNIDLNNIKKLSLSEDYFKFEYVSLFDKIVKNDVDGIYSLIESPWVFKISDNQQSFQINLDDYFTRPNMDNWACDEELVLNQAKDFIENRVSQYNISRDSLSLDISSKSTSKLSFALKWGLISPIRLMYLLEYNHGDLTPLLNKNDRLAREGVFTFISELIWREFYKYILYHFPFVLNTEFQVKYRNTLQWSNFDLAKDRFISWITADTGYPLVDAAMKQISTTGWMHNRNRMVVASILTKNFGVDWRWGQDYFRAMLVDLDEASNNGGWQWSASVGVDPKPIRIFNPYLQAQNYDPKGDYQRFWLPIDYIPNPILDHATARNEALRRYSLKTD